MKVIAAKEALIEEATRAFAADERIVACWLEGSFATGAADPWSDVDLHVAVADSDWDDFLAERIGVIGRVRPVLGFVETTLPWGARLVSANMSGPIRLDLFIEKRSGLASAARREGPVVIFDRGGVADVLRVNWDREAIVRMQLAQMVRLFFFGCEWPARLSGREEWGTLLMNAVDIVYQFLVPAILVRGGGADFFRPQYHNERHLTRERRREINALVEQIRVSFAGLVSGPPDESRVGRVHEQVIGAIWRELRGACEMHGVAYPEAAEREMREYYRRELGWEIAA